MRHIGVAFVVVLSACSSAEDGAPDDLEADGIASAGGSAGAAPVHADAGSGGAIRASGGSSGTGGRSSPGGSSGAGGAVGTGGRANTGPDAAGTGGAIAVEAGPHTVGACDGLKAAGVWEKITPQDPLNVSMNDFAVDPQVSGTVYVGTSAAQNIQNGPGNGIWKTTDCGATWAHINTGTNGKDLDVGLQWTFRIDPTNSQIVYTNAGYGTGGLYKSTNGGIDWANITPPGTAAGFVGNLQMDPDDPKHLLQTWHAGCGADPWGQNLGCIAETRDGGTTWREIFGNPSWASQVRVLLLHGSTWLILDNGIYRTTDGGGSFTKISDVAAAGHSSGTLGEHTGASYYIAHENGLLRSVPGSDGASFTQVPDSGQWNSDVIGDGTTLFASEKGGFRTSPIGDGLTWTRMPGAPDSSCFADYDADHRLLYASCGKNGFWRAVTR